METNWIKPAYALQKVDMQIRELRLRLSLIPVEIKRLQNAQNEANEALQKARGDLHNREVRLKETEQWIASSESNITRLLSASANIRKQDEYDATMKELASTRDKKSDLETLALELMDQISDAQRALKTQTDDTAFRIKDAQEEIAELQDLGGKIEAKVKVLEAERAVKRAAVPESVLSMYERLLQRGKGEPIAVLNNAICSNCNVKVTSQMVNDVSKGEMINCYCSHILTLPEMIEE